MDELPKADKDMALTLLLTEIVILLMSSPNLSKEESSDLYAKFQQYIKAKELK